MAGNGRLVLSSQVSFSVVSYLFLSRGWDATGREDVSRGIKALDLALKVTLKVTLAH